MSLKRRRNRIIISFAEFFKSSAASGIVLIVVTVAALAIANSSYYEAYSHLWHYDLSFSLINIKYNITLHQFINDGLMAIFFFLVGLEIKRELLIGELSSAKKASLPIIAALGGVIVPALIYSIFNSGLPSAKGWAIPMATDIAFALGALALLGKRVPLGIKVFLAALAIADDLAAVLVIAIFFTSTINVMALVVCIVMIIILFMANKLNFQHPFVYVFLGLILWFAMFQSGVHSTIAGIITAMFVPANVNSKRNLARTSESPLVKMEHYLGNYVSFLIMPLFAFSNAGIHISNVNITTLFNPISMGILLGLLIGKPLGISLFVWLSLRFKLANLPDNVNLQKIIAVSFLCGIGFTMSLFIENLSFVTGSPDELKAKLAILLASAVSGVLGFYILKYYLQESSE